MQTWHDDDDDNFLSNLKKKHTPGLVGLADHLAVTIGLIIKVKVVILLSRYTGSAACTRRLVNSSALQSWKWQLIGMS